MTFNVICIKFDQKIKKPKKLNFGLLRFLTVFLKNLSFSMSFSSPDVNACVSDVISDIWLISINHVSVRHGSAYTVVGAINVM